MTTPNFEYEALDGKKRYPGNSPSKAFLGMQVVLLVIGFAAISSSFSHHLVKDSPTKEIERTVTEFTATWDDGCPSPSLTSEVEVAFGGDNSPIHFNFFPISMTLGDFSLHGPNTTLVTDMFSVLDHIYHGHVRKRRHEAHHTDKLFLWEATVSAFLELTAIPLANSSDLLLTTEATFVIKGDEDHLIIKYDEENELPVFLGYDGELWMVAVAGGQLGTQALVQTIIQATEYGSKVHGSEPGRLYVFNSPSTCVCLDDTFSPLALSAMTSIPKELPFCNQCPILQPYVQLIQPTTLGYIIGHDPNMKTLYKSCQK